MGMSIEDVNVGGVYNGVGWEGYVMVWITCR